MEKWLLEHKNKEDCFFFSHLVPNSLQWFIILGLENGQNSPLLHKLYFLLQFCYEFDIWKNFQMLLSQFIIGSFFETFTVHYH